MAETKYVNLYISNNKDELVPIQINSRSSNPIIKDPTGWRASITKFVLNTNTVPILLQDKSLDDYRSITVIYQTAANVLHVSKVQIYWLPNIYETGNNRYLYNQYSYDRILQAINNAYATAFTTLNAFGLSNKPPKFTMNTTLDKIQCTLDSTIISAINNANTTEYPNLPTGEAVWICSNTGMNNWLNGFSNFFVGGTDGSIYPTDLSSIIRFNLEPLPAGTQTIIQSKRTLDEIRRTSNILIISDIGTNKESFPTLSVENGTIITDGSGNADINVFAEYSLGQQDLSTSIIEYLPTAQYRYITLTNSAPLYNFNISAYYLYAGNPNEKSRLQQIYLEEGAFFDIKILFERK